MKVRVQHLKPGDVIGTGEEVINVTYGARTPTGKREVTLYNPRKGGARVKLWWAHTEIGVKRYGTRDSNQDA